MSKTSLSFLLLADDAADQLPDLTAQCLAVAARHATDYELIIVVDGADEATWAQAARLAVTHGPVIAVATRRRLGFRQALREGLRVAGGAAILALDPRQVPPGELPKLLALSDRAAVFGARRPAPRSPRAVAAALAALGLPHGLRDTALRLFLIRSDLQGLIQPAGPDGRVTAEIAAGTRRQGLAVAQVELVARRRGGADQRRAALGLGAAIVAGCLWVLRRWLPPGERHW